MVVPVVLLLAAVVLALGAPPVLARARWAVREPVVGLWAWQCVVIAIVQSVLLALFLTVAAAVEEIRGPFVRLLPGSARGAYLSGAGRLAAPLAALIAVCCLYTLLALLREVRLARYCRRHQRRLLTVLAPRLPSESGRGERLVVLEDTEPDAWSLPGHRRCLVVTTAAMRRLTPEGLEALLDHERGHARYRHHWLVQSAGALARAFPRVRLFREFAGHTGRLVEMAADDSASRCHGRLRTALALVEMNSERGTFGPQGGDVAERVYRLLGQQHRLPVAGRLRLTAAAALLPAVPVLVALAPWLGSALR